MQRFPFGLAIFIFAIVALVLITLFLSPVQHGRLGAVSQLQGCPTRIVAVLNIKYDRPPVYTESYQMRDDNGVSSFEYVVRSYAGKQIVVKVSPHATYDVSFFFGKLITDDGAWDIPDRPPLGNTSVHYTVTTSRTEMCHTDGHTASFTDPQFWATTKKREYHIHLSPKGPLPSIFTLQGTAFRDPRYLEIVNDFRSFGPDNFRSAVASARKQVT